MLYTFGNLISLCNFPSAGCNKCKTMGIYGQKSYFMAALKMPAGCNKGKIMGIYGQKSYFMTALKM